MAGTLINYIKTGQRELALNELESGGADIKTADSSGKRVLHHAAEMGYHDLVEQLILYGAKPNLEDNNGQSPLHLAALGGHVKCIVVLVAHGAVIDAEDWRSCPPIENALISHHLRATEMLFKLGASLHHHDWEWMHKKKPEKREAKMKELVLKNAALMPGYKYGGIEWKLLRISSDDNYQLEELNSAITVKGIPGPFYLYFCRMHSEYHPLDKYLEKNEIVYSCVYELRGWNMPKMKIKLKIDVEGTPKDISDFVLVSPNGRDIGTIDRVVPSEEISYVSITIKIIPDEPVIFAIALTDNSIQTIPIPPESDKVILDGEEDAEIEIPSGSFSSDTSLRLEILETKEHRNNHNLTLITNIWTFTVENGKQPKEGSSIKLKMGCHDDSGSAVVLASHKLVPKQPSDWTVVEAKRTKSTALQFLTCEVPKLFMVCGVHKATLQQHKKQVFETITKCKKKTDDVVFGIMTKMQNVERNTFSLLVECGDPSNIENRQKYWLDKEYAEAKISPEFYVANNQLFKFTFHGKTGTTPSEVSVPFVYQSHRKTQNFKMLELSVANDEVLKAGHVTIDILRTIQPDAIVEMVDGIGCCAGKEEKITIPKAVTEYNNLASLIVGLYFPPVVPDEETDSDESDIEIYEESDESMFPALRYRSLKNLANYLTLDDAKVMAYQFEIDPKIYARIMKSEFSDKTKIFQVLAIWRGKKPKKWKAEELLQALRYIEKPKLASYVATAVDNEHIIHNEAEFDVQYIVNTYYDFEKGNK